MNYTFENNYTEYGDYDKHSIHRDFSINLSTLLRSIAVSNMESQAISNELYTKMDNNNLHYNSPIHILAIMQSYTSLKQRPELSYIEQLALWFHASVNKPGSEYNYIYSAQYATNILKSHISEQWKINSIKQMIQSFDLHLNNDVPDSALNILDLDLIAMALPRHSFHHVCKLIRQEYPEVPAEDYMIESMRYLKKYLAKKSIYRTPYFIKKFEADARENIKSVI